MRILFLIIAVLALTGCLCTLAQGPQTVIDKPTQLTEDQRGNFLVKSGSLYGYPAATGQGVRITGNVTITGPALLQDLVIDGCVLIDRANRVELTRVWVEHCKEDGIQLISDEGKQQSCCVKFDHVMSIGNSASGVHLINTADVFITMSEFENNRRFGAEFNNSPTARIVNSDFGGNTLGGLYTDSQLAMLSNNQYGNNKGDDITLRGDGNLVNSQEFIGPAGACAIRYAGMQHIGVNSYGPRSLCRE